MKLKDRQEMVEPIFVDSKCKTSAQFEPVIPNVVKMICDVFPCRLLKLVHDHEYLYLHTGSLLNLHITKRDDRKATLSSKQESYVT